MDLLQLVVLARQGVPVEQIARSHASASHTEQLVAYMKNKVGLTSPILFFDAELVPPYTLITVDGQPFEAFFSAEEIADFLAEYDSASGATASPLTIAKALLHYHEHDA